MEMKQQWLFKSCRPTDFFFKCDNWWRTFYLG